MKCVAGDGMTPPFSWFTLSSSTVYWSRIRVAYCSRMICCSLRREGVRISRPNFWVVRVSLLGIDRETGFDRFIAKVRGSKNPLLRWHVSSTSTKGRQRLTATGSGSQERKYINVAGSYREDPDLESAREGRIVLGSAAAGGAIGGAAAFGS